MFCFYLTTGISNGYGELIVSCCNYCRSIKLNENYFLSSLVLPYEVYSAQHKQVKTSRRKIIQEVDFSMDYSGLDAMSNCDTFRQFANGVCMASLTN